MRWLPNLITLIRVPVIVLLALVVSEDTPLAALGLLGIGILSHAFDGVVAKWLDVKSGHSGFWHEADTAWLSLGLQLAAAVWLVRADVFPWWVIPIYVVITFLLEFGYVQPRKSARKPFFPIVLWGSAFAWLGLAALIGAQSGIWAAVISLVILVLLALIHLEQHKAQWDYWLDESEGKLHR